MRQQYEGSLENSFFTSFKINLSINFFPSYCRMSKIISSALVFILKGPAAIIGLELWADYYLFPLINLHLFCFLRLLLEVVREGIYSERISIKRHRCYNKGSNSIYIVIYIYMVWKYKNLTLPRIKWSCQIPNEHWTSCQNIWPHN